MARIRSVHPGMASDEIYMSMSITAKAAWPLLWTECDDNGIFEWKPIVLKARIFPADAVDFAVILAEWSELGCVKKIEVDGKPYGLVRNFRRYQRPKNPSYRFVLPKEHELYVGLSGTGTPASAQSSPSAPPVLPQPSASAPENPPQMKEEGGKREEEDGKEGLSRSVADASRPAASEKFEEFWKAYPSRDGPNPREPAERKFRALVKTGVDSELMIAAVKKLAGDEKARGNLGTRFIPKATTWLGEQRWADHAAVAFVAESQNGEHSLEQAVQMFAKTGHWSRYAPVSDVSQVPPELLAKFGLMPDGRKSEKPLG